MVFWFPLATFLAGNVYLGMYCDNDGLLAMLNGRALVLFKEALQSHAFPTKGKLN